MHWLYKSKGPVLCVVLLYFYLYLKIGLLLIYGTAKEVPQVTNPRKQWHKCNTCWNCTLPKKNIFIEGEKGVTL